MIVPTLDTPRLVLRGHRPADTEPMMRAYADGDFSRFITRQQRALSREEAWWSIAMVAGSWAVSGYGMWIVEEKASGEVAGRIGPWAPEGWPDFEIGWAIVPGHQGMGFAVEGAAAAIAWALEALGRDHVIHLIDPRNTASERVAAALGAEVTGIWNSPLGEKANVWTTRWDRFAETPAWARHRDHLSQA
jgi:RimJ/RimL family protein N-acetyltransferase